MSDTSFPVGPTGPRAMTIITNISTLQGQARAYVPLTPEQILANVIKSEAADRAILAPFQTPNMTALNASITEWSTKGSATIYVILSMKLSPPPKCSDGVVRSLCDYISWLIGVSVSVQTRMISANFPGKDISYSVSGNTLRLHVSPQ